MFNLPQSSSILGLDAASNNTRNSTDFSVNSTMMANDSFSRSITDYGFARGLNETFSSVFNNQTLTFADNYNSSTAGVFAVDSNNRRDGGASPSSGIGSMCSSSSSPRSLEDSAPLTSRIQNKLVPVIENEENVVVVAYPDASTTRINDRVLSQIQAVNASVQPRRRGRQSKDEQLVNDNGLPATADQITMMTHQEIQKMMRDPKLSAAQKALIKKIRRRGRNKVAARKCRERRVPTAADGSVAYNNTFYDHPEMEQNKMSEDMYMDGTHFSNYSGPSTSKQSTSSYYHNNLRF
uniref:BZIP domain-containing protein n=1 Tax=Ditylenchus dipsaci TaxID=166011 RepID=A0A915CRF1_9BILA